MRTLFSNYRALRAKLGLSHYTEAEMLDVLPARLRGERRYPNIEHNQQRMTFLARPTGGRAAGVSRLLM